MSGDTRRSGSAAARSQRSASSDDSSPWRWVGGAAVFVGGALLVRSLLRGTAPSTSSAYVMHRNATQRAPEMPPMWRAPTPEYQPPPGTLGAGGRRAASGAQHTSHSQKQQSSHSTAGSTHYQEQRDAQHQEARRQQQRHAEERAQRQREAEFDAAGAAEPKVKKSDFARYEAFAEAERAHYASQAAAGGDDFTSLSDASRAFEMGREQARADFVQSKFMHLKRSKRILGYQSWTGARAAADEDIDEADWNADANEADATASGSFRAIQRQMATQPRFVHARQLLFAPPAAPTTPGTGSESGLPAAPHTLFAGGAHRPTTPLGPLTVNAVRTAYFTRAKLCHPDMGGNPEHFQRLTDAYDLLIGTLQPLEKQLQQRRAARKQQEQPRSPSHTEPAPPAPDK